MEKLLVVCGPTATGKTQAGVRLAKKFGGEIVSADSRQVYRGMDIGTGKDLSAYGNVPVWMLDVVDPKENFSVADYVVLAKGVIADIWDRKKLPILVGGTGFYIKALVDGIDTLGIPPNFQLRKSYEGKITEELFDILFHLNPEVANSLNSSEKKNKPRLIRKIEIEQWGLEKMVGGGMRDKRSLSLWDKDTLLVGLIASPQTLRERINKRIDGWIEEGVEDELVKLLAQGVSWDSQSMNAIGYRLWRSYFEDKVTKEEVIRKWKQDEWQYAKRQITWFKRDKRINWFDITQDGWNKKVEEKVGEWYNESSD